MRYTISFLYLIIFCSIRGYENHTEIIQACDKNLLVHLLTRKLSSDTLILFMRNLVEEGRSKECASVLDMNKPEVILLQKYLTFTLV
jgi:hypothetical protein